MTEVEDPSAIGELEVPLTSVGSNGTRFALAGTFALTGPETLSTVVTSNDATFATADTVTMNPRVGAYTLTLSQWTLHRVEVTTGGAITGTTPMSGAILLDAATQAVTIQNMQTTSVVYRFAVPGSGTVVFARGTLNIDFTVDELPADDDVIPSAACNAATCGGVCADSDGDQQADTCRAHDSGSAGGACDGNTPCAGNLQCLALPNAPTATCVSADIACIRVNEASLGNSMHAVDWVELYNTCTDDVAPAGSLLSATGSVAFPARAVISGGGYWVYGTNEFRQSFAGVTNGSLPFAPGVDGPVGGFSVRDANGTVIDSVGLGASVFAEGTSVTPPVIGVSQARIPNGQDTNDNASDFMLDNTPTPGAVNAL